MRLKTACLFLILAGSMLTFLGRATAQEGHPMVGTWLGEWGPDKAHRNQVTLVMKWDGQKITGIINPGPDKVDIKAGTVLDSTKWMFHLETDANDPNCKMQHFVADGKLENIGSYKRTVTGTYTYGSTKGDFKITRD